MGITESALIGLACVLANSSDNGTIDDFSVSEALKDAERVRIVEVMDSSSCLPMSLSTLINETENGNLEINLEEAGSWSRSGGYNQVASTGQPCEGCFAFKSSVTPGNGQPCVGCSVTSEVHLAGGGQPCVGCVVSKEVEVDLRELVKEMDLVGGKLVIE